MRNAYIKFRTGEDRRRGFQELVAHSQVSELSNGVFCIPWSSLALLDARQLQYSFASEDDLLNAQTIWKFAASAR